MNECCEYILIIIKSSINSQARPVSYSIYYYSKIKLFIIHS